jgi:hypothetical protein
MLVTLTLLVLGIINMSTVNLRVAGNEQTRRESIAGAQQAIEQVISTNFPVNPQPVNVAVSINGSGTTNYNVAVAQPTCENSVPIKNIQLVVTRPTDVACFASATTGGAGATGNSVCSNTVWDIAATATDAAGSGSTVTVHQGVGERVPIGTTC